MKKYYFTILFLFILLLSLLGQSTGTYSFPIDGSKTYYTNVEWDGGLLEFNNPRNVIWDFTDLRPGYIVKEEFKSEANCTECLQYHKENNVVHYYEANGNQLYLRKIKDRVFFTKDQSIIYNVVGTCKAMPIMQKGQKTFTNEYKLIAKLAIEALNYQFDFLPKNTDSIAIESTIMDTYRLINNGILELYHLRESAALINVITRSQLDIKIKYNDSEEWYNYKYRTSNLPPHLIKIASRIPTTSYKYYCKSYAFPVLEYDIKGNGAANIRLQDNINPLHVPMINYDEKFISCNPNPVTRKANFYLSNFPFSTYRIEVSNFVGKVVQKANFRKLEENVFRMDMKHLPYGLYFYDFIDANGVRSRKNMFIKIKE